MAGLSVGSDVVLPGLVALGNIPGEPDVTIRSGTVPLALEDAEAHGPTWSMAQGRFLFRLPNLARFLLRDGREIVFEMENGTPAEDVAAFFCGSVFGILLHQRSQIVLHASAIDVNGKAVLFCGASGAGKSTLAAAFVRRGYRLLCDELCAIRVDGVPTVPPDGRMLRLWKHSIDRLDLSEKCGARVRETIDKFFVEAEGAGTEELPLGAIYDLRELRAPLKPGIERPNIVDAALILRRNAYRPRLVRQMNQRDDYFRAAAAMANAAGIFSLTRAFRFEELDDVIAWLERHWDERGLTGRRS